MAELLVQVLSILIIIGNITFLFKIKKFICSIYKLRKCFRILDMFAISNIVLITIHCGWLLFNTEVITIGSTFVFQLNYILYSLFIIKFLLYSKCKCEETLKNHANL